MSEETEAKILSGNEISKWVNYLIRNSFLVLNILSLDRSVTISIVKDEHQNIFPNLRDNYEF